MICHFYTPFCVFIYSFQFSSTHAERSFSICHYESSVKYVTDNFISTNQDRLSDDVINVFNKSTCSFGDGLKGGAVFPGHFNDPVEIGGIKTFNGTTHSKSKARSTSTRMPPRRAQA